MKNCLKIFLLSLVISFFFLPTEIEAFSGSGSGTENSPYVITTCAQLQEMNLDLDGYYELGNDIDCSVSSGWSWAGGTGFQPVGGMWGGPGVPSGATQDAEFTSPVAGPVFSFQGELDGKGFNISNAEGSSTVPYGAMFGVTNHAVIKNLTLTNPNFDSAYIYGSLIAYARDTEITNVDIVLDLDGASAPADYSDAGAVAGYVEGTETVLTDVNVSGFLGTNTNMGSSSGGMIGVVKGDLEILDSSSSLVVDFSGGYGFGCAVGYFAGDTDGTLMIDNFESTCSVETGGGGAISGIVGRAEASAGHLGFLNIVDSSFDGNITTTDGIWAVGGIVGYASARITGSIDNCDANVDFDMTGAANQTGALIGANRSDDSFNVTSSSASGTIDIDAGTGSIYLIGGLVGASNYDMTIDDSHSTVAITITNTDYAELIGGIAGRLAANSEVNNSYTVADIAIATIPDESPAYAVGGIVGAFNMGAASVNDSFYIGSMIFTGYNASSTGGIVGDVDAGSINRCYSEITVTTEGSWGDYAIGGICGSCDGEIHDSATISDITVGIDSSHIGGLAGYADLISKSYAETSIYAPGGSQLIGGLAGQLQSTNSIQNSYARGTVTGEDDADYIGGLVGMMQQSFVTNSYSTVQLSIGPGATYFGGLIGEIDAGDAVSTVTNSYWDEDTSFLAFSDGGTGYSTSQMKVQNNFDTWDFDDIWGIDNDINDGYPHFLHALVDLTVSKTGSSAYSKSYDIDLTFGGSWKLTEVKYQWATGLAPSGSDWITITSYDDLDTPVVTGGRYLHIYGSNILGQDVSFISSGFLFDNTPPTVEVDEDTRTVTIDVEENESGISVVQYFWSESTSTPSGGWQDTSQGEEIDKPEEAGTWYLHVRSLDNAGNLVLGISDAVEVSGEPVFVYIPSVVVNEPQENNKEEEPPVNNVPDEIPVVKTPKIPEIIVPVTESRSIGEILSAFVKEPIVKTSILATGIASSAIVLSPAFWLNWGIGIWERILGLFGVFVRKKNKRSGVVYDSRTKEPIKLAVVRFFDKEDKLITTEVTDSMGIFNFETEGEYRIEVSARRYTFPSSLIKGSDSVYANIYSGGYISDGEVSIPLDEKENGIVRSMLVFLANRTGMVLNIVCWMLFILGFGLVLYDLSNGVNTENVIMISVYTILLITSFVSLVKNQGHVYSAYGDVLSGYKVILRDKVVNSVSYQRIVNEEGEYRFVVPEGEYTLQVINTNDDVVFTKDILDYKVKNGLITIVEDIVI